MKHSIGIVSDAYITNNEFGIDFSKYKEYGFDALDYQGLASKSNKPNLYEMSDEDFRSYFARLYKEISKHDLKINQLHSLWEVSFKNTPDDLDIFEYHKKALVAASILKTKYVVFHTIPVPGYLLWDKVDYDTIFKINKDFFLKLLLIAKELNVYIAIENLPFLSMPEFFSPSGTLKLINEINDPYVVMCLDTGHFNMYKEKIYDFLLNAGDKLGCLHIHDNNGYSDSHQIPYLGSFDWKSFIKGLRDINFAGVLSLETKANYENTNKEVYDSINKTLLVIINSLRKELDEK